MELDTVIALGIIAVSIIIAFLFARRTNWRILKSSPAVEDSSESSALDHYTEMRDKLSLKKKDDEVIDENESSGLIGPIIGIAVATIVAYNVLLPTLKTAQNTVNTTGWDSGVSNAVVSNLWGMGMTSILVVVGFVFIILSMFGFMGGSDDKPKKSKRKRGVEHYTEMRDKLTLESNENEKS